MYRSKPIHVIEHYYMRLEELSEECYLYIDEDVNFHLQAFYWCFQQEEVKAICSSNAGTAAVSNGTKTG